MKGGVGLGYYSQYVCGFEGMYCTLFGVNTTCLLG